MKIIIAELVPSEISNYPFQIEAERIFEAVPQAVQYLTTLPDERVNPYVVIGFANTPCAENNCSITTNSSIAAIKYLNESEEYLEQ